MLVEELKSLKKGDKILIVGDTLGTGHGAKAGTEALVESIERERIIAKINNGSYYVGAADISFFNRKNRAESKKRELTELKERIATLEEEVTTLSQFDSDEEELASLIVDAMDSKMSTKDRIAKITKLLQKKK